MCKKMLVLFLFSFLVVFVAAGRLDIGICGDWNVPCQCGSSYQFTIPVKQCTRFYRWKPQCKPCNDVNQAELCSKFTHCLECNRDQCTKCPPNKYGQFCAGVCQCENGGVCDINGACVCPSGFTGPKCQMQQCLPPEPMANTDIAAANIQVGSSAVYTCQPGYSMPPDSTSVRICGADGRWSGHAPHCLKRCPELELPPPLKTNPDLKELKWFVQSTTFFCPENFTLSGPTTINCLSNGEWDNRPPRCVSTCPVPASIDNGHAFYQSQDLIEGGIIRYVCARDYLLVGQKEITCKNGNWSHPTPKCEKIVYCADPGIPEFGERRIERGIGDEMSMGTKLFYSCTKESILIGSNEMTCGSNSTWSHDRPHCIFVSDQEIVCETKGSDVMSANQAPLRITCPAGCLKTNPQVWGTVIYKKDSQVCVSAIHAGMITAEGGSVLLVNNGVYNQFVPSSSNGVKTKRYRGASESYRFNYVDQDEETVCPKGWSEIDDHCVIYVDRATVWKRAAATCHNLNSKLLELDASNSSSTVKQVEQRMRNVKGRIWSGVTVVTKLDIVEDTNGTESSNVTGKIEPREELPKEITISKKVLENTHKNECGTLDIKGGNLNKEDCQQKLAFLCATAARLIEPEGPACEEPESLAHGNFEVNFPKDDVYSEGTVVKFRCQPLYYLSGTNTMTCLENSTWSSQPPKCVKAAACVDPPTINNGFFDVIPEPKARMRANAKPTPVPKQQLTHEERHLLESEKVNLPANYNRVNSRIQFECESRYYKLIGSSIRTCLADGTWSGRQPSCQPDCGISSAPRSPFVVGGKPSIAGQWPWQVGIARQMENPNPHNSSHRLMWYMACGGALLTESWMVTAAHCVTYEGTAVVVQSDEMRLYLGKYYRDDKRDDSQVQIREVESIQVHPNFNPVIYDSDIALVNLKRAVKLSSRVQPVCLTDPYSGISDRHLKVGTIATVTGWGRDNDSDIESYPEVLMQAEVKIVSNDECEDGYRQADVPLSVTGNMFCAGNDNSDGQTDACSGDSGGPLVVSEGVGVTEKWYLEGIVSWGSPRGCGLHREYGGYTKVSAFIDWIKQFI
uniref:limulus clotting factor C n=1 Tax=Niponia nodulosa TaxID=1325555 RepID=A0A0E4FMY1_9MYRI|nr:limulus clotting factor C-like [Niponia nodulosa]